MRIIVTTLVLLLMVFDSKEVEEALQDVCRRTIPNCDARSKQSTATYHGKDMTSATDNDVDVEPNVKSDDNSKCAKKKKARGAVRHSETLPRTGLGGSLNAKSKKNSA